MFRPISTFAVAAAFALSSTMSSAQVTGLEVDGQAVATGDELVSIQFDTLPATADARKLTIRSVFEDLRCVTASGEPLQTTGDTMLVLDQFNLKETDAEYDLANTGTIAYDADTGVLTIGTTDDPDQQLECASDRQTAFWGSDFENAFQITAETPASPFPIDNVLTIPFTVTNQSPTVVFSDVLVDFDWTATDPSDQPVAEVPGPTFSPSGNVSPLTGNEFRWDAGILWPGESRTLNVNYALGTDVPPDTLITTRVFDFAASNREGTAELPVVGNTPVVSEVVTGEASLTIDKVETTGLDPVTQAGQQLDYTITLVNDGTFTLTGVEVIDTFPDASTVTLTIPDREALTQDGVFESGETWEFDVSYTVTQTDIDTFAGSTLVNKADASSVEVPGPITATAETAVTASESDPSVAFSADPTLVDSADQDVVYTLVLTHDAGGQLSLTGIDVSASSPTGSGPGLAFGAPVEDGAQDGKLNPGESWTYTATYDVQQADLDAAGPEDDELSTVAAVLTDQTGLSNSSAVDVDLVPAPSVKLTKRITGGDNYAAPDEVISYAFDVENDGNQTLTGPLSLDDPLTQDESCQALSDGELTVGEVETAICSATYTVGQTDIDAGSVENTATVTLGNLTDVASAQANADQQPGLGLDGSLTAITVVNTSTADAGLTQYANAGDKLDFEHIVTNTGNTTLAGPVNVNFGIAGNPTPDLTVSCQDLAAVGDGDSNLDPEDIQNPGNPESLPCTVAYVVSQEDVDAGSVTLEASADADGVSHGPAPFEVIVQANQDPRISAQVNAVIDDDSDGIDETDVIRYTFELTNIGNVTLTDVAVTLNAGASDGPVAIFNSPIAEIAPGTTNMTVTGEHAIDSNDLARGDFAAFFTVSSNEAQ